MSFFFRGAITSSPIKNRDTKEDESCHSLDGSFLSDSSYECFSTNPLTGSVCQCRRSPRLLGNGYYVLTEDSFAVDDQGNVTLTPSKTNVSYKENLVRIFRRRRRVRKSLASLLSDVSQSCQSWLGGGVFGWPDPAPQEELFNDEHGHTPCGDDHTPSVYPRTPLKRGHTPIRLSHTPDREFPHSFTYDQTENGCSPDKLKISQEEGLTEEACFSQEQFSQSVGGLLEVPPPSTPSMADTPPLWTHPQVSDVTLDTANHERECCSALMKAFLLLILLVCVCTAVSSRWLMGGVAVVMTFLLMSSLRKDVRWRRAKTEDITSKNE
ncbi:transmembrane protein 71 [Clupea harengus]|uniref:Transmembrane protein 71 n=1 Tax=Clupea harengus TaxID=7950 RepID=A0A6P8GCC2_CLUHA|nr:transmembrane protein 71 [Clupea harengus]